MAHLLPCKECNRHVRVDATQCPFCESPVDFTHLRSQVPAARLGRAALFALGAAFTLGCSSTRSGEVYGAPPVPDSGSQDGADAGDEADADDAPD